MIQTTTASVRNVDNDVSAFLGLMYTANPLLRRTHIYTYRYRLISGAFHAMDVMHVFGGAWRNFINMTFSEETTRSLRELLRQAAYDGSV